MDAPRGPASAARRAALTTAASAGPCSGPPRGSSLPGPWRRRLCLLVSRPSPRKEGLGLPQGWESYWPCRSPGTGVCCCLSHVSLLLYSSRFPSPPLPPPPGIPGIHSPGLHQGRELQPHHADPLHPRRRPEGPDSDAAFVPVSSRLRRATWIWPLASCCCWC